MFALLDCNNFYVSCERLFRPDTLGKPVIVVGGNNGVIVSRSNEAKELGIPMAAPLFQIKEDIKKHNIVVFHANFELYKDISARVMNVLKEEVDEVYQYSIDEAFMVLKEKDMEKVHAELARLKALIEQNVGVPVSLGAAKTMTLAKYASEYEKRGSGVCVLEGETWERVQKDTPLSAIWGIGYRTARTMREQGLVHVPDLLHADASRISTLFGVHGSRMQMELSEKPVYHPKDRSGMQKSIMSTRSLAQVTTNRSELESALGYHIERVAEELREMDAVCRTLSVSLLTNRFSEWTLRGGRKDVVLVTPTNDTRTLLKETLRIFNDVYEKGVPYKKVGVVLSRIEPSMYQQHTLFEETKGDTGLLMKALDAINTRFGPDTLTLGRVVPQRKRGDMLSPRYTTRWSEVKKV